MPAADDRSCRPDAAHRAGPGHGAAARTWLRISAADGPEQEAARAVLSLLRLSAGGRLDLPPAVAEGYRPVAGPHPGRGRRSRACRRRAPGRRRPVRRDTHRWRPRPRAGRRARRAPARRCVVSAPLLAGILGLALLDAVNPARILGVALILLLPAGARWPRPSRSCLAPDRPSSPGAWRSSSPSMRPRAPWAAGWCGSAAWRSDWRPSCCCCPPCGGCGPHRRRAVALPPWLTVATAAPLGVM